ncbi:MAG: DUF3560 domain-containing protein [Clostridiales bacterium]|nr:DUF3560 domain-containing protein [Clostridiales bacterium]
MDKQERINRLTKRLNRYTREAERYARAAQCISDGIPFGQPILVDHHSEQHHRRDLDRMHRYRGKSIEYGDRARQCERQIRAVEMDDRIYSSDAGAIDTLKEKLAKLEENHELMVRANRLVKKGDRASLEILIGPELADKLATPDVFGVMGFPAYAIAKNRANARRIKKRIKDLEVIKNAKDTEDEINGIGIIEDVTDMRIRLVFPDKPSPDVIKSLKSHGFRWSPRARAWQRLISSEARYWAYKIAQAVQHDGGNQRDLHL